MWSSIFAGAVIALATQLVLTLIGTAIGLATLNPASGDSPSATALGSGAGIWLIVSSIISLFSAATSPPVWRLPEMAGFTA